MRNNPELWTIDCLKWRGRVLTGHYSHWCNEWDGLPVDETTREFDCCLCYKGVLFQIMKIINRARTRRWERKEERRLGR